MNNQNPPSSENAGKPAVYNAGTFSIHLWAVGAISDYWMYALFAFVQPMFTTGFGLDPKLVGLALSAPRIVDAIADPILGHASDDTHTRWGRRRPYLFVTAILGAMLLVGLWRVGRDANQWLQFAWLMTFTTMLFLCWGTYSMNHMALGYELSDDYNIRTKIMAVRAFYFSMAALGGGSVYWLAINLGQGLNLPIKLGGWSWTLHTHPLGNEINGIRVISFGVAALTIIPAFITIFTCKERFKSANRRHVNLIEAIKATLKIRPFVVLVVLRIVQTLGTSLWGAMAFYVTTYSVCQNNKSLATSLSFWAGLAGFGISFTMIPLSTRLTRWLGKRSGLILGYGLAFLSGLTLPFFALVGHPYLLLCHTVLFGAVGNSILNLFINSVMPDICDLDESQTGARREALFSAVMSFINKIENSVCSLLGGYLLSFSGFDSHKAKLLIQQAPEVLTKMRLYGFTPAIIFSGLAFALVWRFPLTKEQMDEVRAKLDARRRVAVDIAPLESAEPDPVG